MILYAPLSDAVSAGRSTVSSVDGLLSLGEGSVCEISGSSWVSSVTCRGLTFSGSESGDLNVRMDTSKFGRDTYTGKGVTTVTTLGGRLPVSMKILHNFGPPALLPTPSNTSPPILQRILPTPPVRPILRPIRSPKLQTSPFPIP